MTDLDEALLLDATLADVERLLPSYPDALFALVSRQLDLPPDPVVVDVGAGSGRASLAMARLGWHVIAVDPDGPSLAVLRARATRDGLKLTTLQATAESTGLDGASADLVVAAQAFHWFDMRRALVEIARITRPAGGTALFWNVRDRHRSPIVADYNRVLDRYGDWEHLYLEAELASGRITGDALAHADGFGSARLLKLRHGMAMSSEDFVRLALNAPYVRALTQVTQTEFRKEVEELLASHGCAAGDSFTLPYLINCWVAQRDQKAH